MLRLSSLSWRTAGQNHEERAVRSCNIVSGHHAAGDGLPDLDAPE
jgi:hypothetical protein